jgi:hypothetical protein
MQNTRARIKGRGASLAALRSTKRLRFSEAKKTRCDSLPRISENCISPTCLRARLGAVTLTRRVIAGGDRRVTIL